MRLAILASLLVTCVGERMCKKLQVSSLGRYKCFVHVALAGLITCPHGVIGLVVTAVLKL